MRTLEPASATGTVTRSTHRSPIVSSLEDVEKDPVAGLMRRPDEELEEGLSAETPGRESDRWANRSNQPLLSAGNLDVHVIVHYDENRYVHPPDYRAPRRRTPQARIRGDSCSSKAR